MMKRIGITLGLCGLTVMGGVGLSMAQSALSENLGVDETLSFTLDEASTPIIAGVQYVAYVPQDVPLADIFSDAPLLPVETSLQMHAELDPLPGHVRPVARPEMAATPEANVSTAAPTKPVFSQPVSLPTYKPSQSVNVSRYQQPKLGKTRKLQARALIGVFR